ncbi:AAA family ATPase [Candidatus Dojkabacteria bacterium]|nr:AAA family ATPase [Candidatus Dojkabacteria bacterium]
MDQTLQKQINVQDMTQPASTANANLNGSNEMIEEIELLGNKVAKSTIPDEMRDRLDQMIDRLRRMAKLGSYSGEFELIQKYIDWVVSIPWNTYTQDRIDLVEAKKIMDSNHYGMNSVKDLILDYLAVMQLQLRKDQEMKSGVNPILSGGSQETVQNNDMSKLQGSSSHAPIICFVGLQGVGKTTMAKSIAQALGRKFVRVALGALGSVTQLRGQSRAYLDAEPGQIVKALVRVKSMNPVILLDEIDKVSGQKGLLSDVMAALLEILDPEQNSTFIDHYLDFPLDLSNIMFVCTANNLGTLSAALLDRLEIVRFTSYSDEEKTVIAKNYLMEKVLKSTSLRPEQLEISPDVWPYIVRPLGFDAGIRQLERNLTSLCRRAARKVIEENVEKVVVTMDNIKQFMPEGIGTLS